MMDKMYIAEQIEKERTSQNLSREKLAEKAGVSSSLIYQVESGKKTIGLTALMRVASALEVSLDTLVYDQLNTKHEFKTYMRRIEKVVADCTTYEMAVLVDSMHNLKQVLRQHTKQDATEIAIQLKDISYGVF